MNTESLERQKAEENTWEKHRGRAATKLNGNGIQEEQFVFIARGSKRTSPLQLFTARVPQIIAQILVTPCTELLLSTTPAKREIFTLSILQAISILGQVCTLHLCIPWFSSWDIYMNKLPLSFRLAPSSAKLAYGEREKEGRNLRTCMPSSCPTMWRQAEAREQTPSCWKSAS